LFQAKDIQNCMALFIFTDGNAKLGTQIDGKWQLASRANWDAIKRQPGDENELRVVIVGKSVTAYVNNQELGTIKLKNPAAPLQFGIWAESDADHDHAWEYSDFEVRQPKPAQ